MRPGENTKEMRIERKGLSFKPEETSALKRKWRKTEESVYLGNT